MTAHNSPASSAERPPLRQPLMVLLVTVVLAAGAGAWGVLAAPASYQAPLLWGLGASALVFCPLPAVVTYQVHRLRLLRERLAERDRVAADFARETVPALIDRLRSGTPADAALVATELPDEPAYRTVAELLATEVGRGENSRAAAMAACANAAGRMQALATSMLADLREMEHRHTNEDVLGDLLHLDHRTAQAGRVADSIAVLTGARSGRRWAKPIVMESVLRGAMGRIAGYRRVRLHSTSTVAVAGHAAEGVMHALAELLDNASTFSPPTAEVHVYVEEVPSGVVVTVEDSGLVMSDVALRRAQSAVSPEPLDLTTLSGTRLGLAVVGCLARKYRLQVSFRPSARGGTGALMMIPHELVSRPQEDRDSARVVRTRRPASADGAAQPGATAARSGDAESGDAGGASQTRETAVERAAGPPAVHARDEGRIGAPRAPHPVETAPPSRAPASASSRETPVATPEHAPATHGSSDADVPDDAPVSPSRAVRGGSGLPQRRRGQTLAAAHPEGATAAHRDPAPTHTPAESAARFGAFRRAVQGGETGQHRVAERPTGGRTAAAPRADDHAAPAASDPAATQRPSAATEDPAGGHRARRGEGTAPSPDDTPPVDTPVGDGEDRAARGTGPASATAGPADGTGAPHPADPAGPAAAPLSASSASDPEDDAR